jgi:hypothetical protein
MQWKQVSSGSAHVYHLADGDNILLTLTINYKSSSLRAECASAKRAFFIHKEGIWKNRTVLKNEYGYKIGQMYYEKWHSDNGIVEIDEKKFRYIFRNNPQAEIAIFNEDETEPVVICGLATVTGQTTVKINRDGEFEDADMKYMLFALTWYLFLLTAQENTVDFAMS